MNVVDIGSRVGADVDESATTKVVERPEETILSESEKAPAASDQSIVMRWFMHDLPFVAMLLLALGGLVFQLSVMYWLVLTPVFAIISIVEGWRHFSSRSDRLGLMASVAAIWCALLLSVYLLYSGGVQGVLNGNGTSLVMMTLLALGTFVAGIQSRVWQICAVGGILFLAVPGLGWIDQSPLLLLAITVVIIAAGGVSWWVLEGGKVRLAVEPAAR